MKKDFEKWNSRKISIHQDKERPFFHTREIWFCTIGANVGFEQDGRGDEYLRPVIVIKKFNNEVCWVAPLTKGDRKGKYYFSFSFVGSEHPISSVILSQMRLLDAKRLTYKVGDMNETDFIAMKKLIIKLLE